MKSVVQLNLNGKVVKVFKSIAEASRATGISYTGISKCAQDKQKYSHAGGYYWIYLKLNTEVTILHEKDELPIINYE